MRKQTPVDCAITARLFLKRTQPSGEVEAKKFMSSALPSFVYLIIIKAVYAT